MSQKQLPITPKASLGNLFKLSFLDDLGIPTDEFIKNELPKVHDLHPKVRHYIEDAITLCQPAKVHICDGSDEENKALWKFMKEAGYVVDIPKLENCILARTDPRDVPAWRARRSSPP
jgi:GTP-dependent phosphoenolpyruvate carboxykinase